MTESGEGGAGAEPLVVETFAIGSLGCNCSLVYERDSRRAIVIDPGDDPEALLQAVGERGLKVTQLLHTHAHFDHIGGSDAVKRRLGTPILLHRDDEELYRRLQEQGLLFGIRVPPPGEVDQFIEEGFEVMLGARTLLTTIHTPGHSPGSCCFYTEVTGKPLLFAGDTLFRQSVGRTDLPGGDPYALIKSIKQRLFELPAESYVVPGHGEHTTLHAEQRHNPFLYWAGQHWAGQHWAGQHWAGQHWAPNWRSSRAAPWPAAGRGRAVPVPVRPVRGRCRRRPGGSVRPRPAGRRTGPVRPRRGCPGWRTPARRWSVP